MQTRLSRLCDRVIEAGWLLAVVLVPTFFNARTSRVFEPDKGALLRSLALVMTAVWLVKATEYAVYWLGSRLGWIEWARPSRPHRPWLFYVLVALFALFAAATLGATLTSVHPRISLMGSYQRGQGTYFTLCLIAIALLIATHLRTRDQLGRLLAAVALGSLPVTLYAVIQRAGADPLPWGTSEPIVASTLGNSDFLADYLAMTIPLTLAGLLALLLALWNGLQDRGGTTFTARAIGYGLALLCGLFVLGLQVYALALTGNRIALLSLLTAAVPFALLLVTIPLRGSRRCSIPLGLAGILILGILLVLTAASFADVSFAESPITRLAESSQSPGMTVRRLIWQGARELITARPVVGDQPDRWAALRPLLGYGPETMYFTYNQVYQPEIGHYESRQAVPDRAHNQLLDVGVNLGWAGVAVFLLLLTAFFGAGVTRVATARTAFEAIVVSGVLCAGLAHFVAAQFGIPTVSARLLFWVGLGVVAALVARREPETSGAGQAATLASGVALLLLPMTALVAVAVAGFLRIPQDGVGLGIVTLVGLLLAVAAAVVNGTAGRRGRAEGDHWQQRYLLANGSLCVLALLLLVGTGLIVMGRMNSLTEHCPMPSDWDVILRQTEMYPVLAWGVVFLGVVSVALSLPRPRTSPVAWNRRDLIASVVAAPLYVLALVGAAVLIVSTCLRPLQADAVFKLAYPWDRSGTWERAVCLYERAIELAPQEDFYYLFLGRAQMEQARSESIPAFQEPWLARATETLERARSFSPLNPDHVANLARFHRRTADLETERAAREAHVRLADGYYAAATALAPQNVILLNEWATLQWYSLNNEEEACRLLERSLELDPEFDQTQGIYADTCSQTLPEQPTNLDFEH